MTSRRAAQHEEVATPKEYGELVPAVVGMLLWALILINEITGRRFVKAAPGVALETVWIVVIAVPLAGWTLLMRLRWSSARLGMTVGPLKRYVDLGQLESIRWKKSGGWRSEGTIFVRDNTGHKVPIWVGRFRRMADWGAMLLGAADACGATVDAHSRAILGNHDPRRD
jgi:hypothetical protein